MGANGFWRLAPVPYHSGRILVAIFLLGCHFFGRGEWVLLTGQYHLSSFIMDSLSILGYRSVLSSNPFPKED